jgi:hypothetical protein
VNMTIGTLILIALGLLCVALLPALAAVGG